jgi:hypothetical protein
VDLLRRVRAAIFCLDLVKPLARGDEQRFVILNAEAEVGGSRFQHLNAGNFLTRLVEHDHTVAGEVEIALGVEGHAVRTKFAVQAFVCQRAVGLDVVGESLASAARQRETFATTPT